MREPLGDYYLNSNDERTLGDYYLNSNDERTLGDYYLNSNDERIFQTHPGKLMEQELCFESPWKWTFSFDFFRENF